MELTDGLNIGVLLSECLTVWYRVLLLFCDRSESQLPGLSVGILIISES